MFSNGKLEKCKDIKAKPAPIRRTKTIHFKQSNFAANNGTMKRGVSAVVNSNNHVSKKAAMAPTMNNNDNEYKTKHE